MKRLLSVEKMTRREFNRMIAALGVASMFSVGCNAEDSAKKGANAPVKVSKDKVLVVYFSWSGNTKFAAETIAKELGGAKLAEIKAAKPYNSDFNKCCEEAKPECRGKKLREILPVDVNVADYDVILVGTPDWWGTMSPPVRTFLVNNIAAFKGKTVCLFQTHGGGGMERVGSDFAALMKESAVLPPRAFSGSSIRSSAAMLKKFVSERVAVE